MFCLIHALHFEQWVTCAHPSINVNSWDFPGGPAVENPPSNVGDVGSIPGQGTKIPHVAGLLGPHATTKEPMCRNYRAHTLWSLSATTKENPTRATTKDPVCCN